MEKKPKFSRWRYWMRFHLPNLIYIVLLIAIAAGSYWWIKRDSNDNTKAPEKHPELIDAFAEGITLNRTNKDGSVGYVITAKDIVHYGDQDGTVKNITLVATPTGQPAMTAVAQNGTWSWTDKEHIIKLTGDVKLTRAGSDNEEEMVMTTQAIDVDLYDAIASTEQPFKVTQGKSEMTGQGLIYDYVARDLTLGGKKAERVKATLYGHEIKKGS